ncbi:MAG: DUF4282 domain-containing protein [Chloroflexota bacterium]|nr:DUF4282 domain-containing protein [Chloroflexota bacterium]
MKDFFTFRRRVAPPLVQIYYWLATAGVAIIGLAYLVTSEDARGRITGVLIWLLALPAIRVEAEVLLHLFRTDEALNEIRRNTQPK